MSLLALALVGVGVGYVAGMFGVGGGFMLTPILISVFRVPAPVAVGSALCQTCGTAIASFLKYRHLRRGEPRIDLVMIGGSLIGVDAGTRILNALAERASIVVNGRSIPAATLVVDLMFILLLTFVTAYVARDAFRKRVADSLREDASVPGPLVTRVRVPPFIDLPRVGLRRVSVPMMSYIGFVLGVASGLMGIGGGVLFMPVLLYGFGMSMRNAAGTGILLLLVTSVIGTVEQAARGYVSLQLAMAVLVGSSIGTQLGALSTHVLPNRVLRLLFAGLVAATTVMIAADLLHTISAR